MLRLNAFGVRNLRSLEDTGLIELKPITILVGKNSAGKSTFARVLPLLKQSSERRKQGPLLWFGRLVDFGSFNEAISSFASNGLIDFRFQFQGSFSTIQGRRSPRLEALSPREGESVEVTLQLGAEGEDGRTVLRALSLDVFGVKINIAVASSKEPQIEIDGLPVRMPSNGRAFLAQGAILPVLRLLFRGEAVVSTVSDAAFFSTPQMERLGLARVRAAISAFVHGNTLTERKDEIARRLPVASPNVLLEYCRSLAGVPDTWRTNMAASTPQSPKVLELQRALVVFNLESLLAELDDAILSFSAGVSYLEPLRATAQRYYRREEVSIEELDPKGLNTTFFLQGLSVRERDELNGWLTTTFGFSLSVRTVGGHSSLNIEVAAMGHSRNMADVGLGYSQLVPVAIQLWASMRRRPIRSPLLARSALSSSQRAPAPIVVVEQPELHLHPAYQAKLADVFTACVARRDEGDESSRRLPLRIVAETHSPNLINRLGELVGEGVLSADDVQVIVFESEFPNPATSIRIAKFNEKGILQNWPIGFFEY